jgi:hypothetical protein
MASEFVPLSTVKGTHAGGLHKWFISILGRSRLFKISLSKLGPSQGKKKVLLVSLEK